MEAEFTSIIGSISILGNTKCIVKPVISPFFLQNIYTGAYRFLRIRTINIHRPVHIYNGIFNGIPIFIYCFYFYTILIRIYIHMYGNGKCLFYRIQIKVRIFFLTARIKAKCPVAREISVGCDMKFIDQEIFILLNIQIINFI